MFCHKCGSKSLEDAIFCQKCGAKLIKDEAETQASVEPIIEPASVPAETPSQSAEPTSTAAQESVMPKPIAPASEGTAEVYDLLKEKMSSCSAIKAVTQAKNGTILKGTIHKYLIIIATSGQAVIVSSLAFPFIILDWISYGLICMIVTNISWDFMEYGSIQFEDFSLMFALSLLIGGLIKTVTPFLGRKEKEAISTYVSEIAEAKGIALAAGTVKTKIPATRLAASIIPALVGIVILIFVMMDNLGSGSNGDIPAATFDNSASSTVENVSEESKTENSFEGSQSMQWKMAYTNKVRELAAEDPAPQFALINLTGSDIPALVADYSGYRVSVFNWVDETLVTVMEDWSYGAMGNHGYEYLPGGNVIRSQNSDQAGAIVYESYMKVNDAREVVDLYDKTLSLRYFKDTNNNSIMDENESYSEEPYYYYGDTEVTADKYASYQIPGNYEQIIGDTSAEAILSQLGVEIGTVSSVGFPLVVSTDAINVFAEWAEKHPLVGDYHLDLISDDTIDNEGNKIFLFTYEGGGGIFNMSIRKSDGYMEYTSKFDKMSMDEWYKDFSGETDQSMPDRVPGTVPSGLLYKGQLVMDLLGMKPEELNQIFGAPTGGTPVTGELFHGATEFYVYDGIGFMLNEQGTVSYITIVAEQVELNGQTLNQNRAGILNLLGTPEQEEQLTEDESGEGLGGYYIIRYSTYDGGFVTDLTIKMPDAESNAYNVEISQIYVD